MSGRPVLRRRRILLVGEGALPGPAVRETRFSSLRLAQFAAALDEHDVTVVDCLAGDAGLRARGIDPARPDRHAADVVVSAGPYGPTRLALRVAGPRPLWIDLPGDPFADAQMYAWNTFDPTPAAHVETVARDADRVFRPALARADRFSSVSGASRHALLGQLGLLGRLVRAPPGAEWVHVVPIAWAFGGLEERAPRPVPGRPLRVLLAGSLNTWFDTSMALDGLLAAMDEVDIEVDVTGGAVDGHHARDAEVVEGRIRASRHAARFRWHGWLPEAAFASVLADADVGLCVDRPGFEPELGSRTRVLLYLHQGLDVIATARGELVRELVALGYVHAVPTGDGAAVARSLVALARGEVARCRPDRGLLRAAYTTEATTRALREWARVPERRPPAPGRRGLLDRWRR